MITPSLGHAGKTDRYPQLRICANLESATTNDSWSDARTALRAQCGSLDALLVKMNNSASALAALQIKND